jgi:hypothetical protein
MDPSCRFFACEMDLEPSERRGSPQFCLRKFSGTALRQVSGTRRTPREIRGSTSGGSLLGNGTVLCKKVSREAE